MFSYIKAGSTNDYEMARQLFKEYAVSINIDLGFQHFDEELDSLRTMYGAPKGGIILCKSTDEYAGCVAIREMQDDTGELKRMYVKPEYQHKGIGRALLEKALELARDCGYKKIRLDTLDHMLPAISLYEKAGFRKIDAYYFNPHPTAVFFEVVL